MTMVSLPSNIGAWGLSPFRFHEMGTVPTPHQLYVATHHGGNGAFGLERRLVERAITRAAVCIELHGAHEIEQLAPLAEFFVHPAPALFAHETSDVPRARQDGFGDATPAGIRLNGRDRLQRAAHQPQMRTV